MRFKILQKKSTKLLFVATIIASISIGTTIFLLYMQSSKEISDSYEISSEEIDISEIEINNQIQIGDITLVQSIKNPINIFEAKWKINYKGIYDPSEIIKISYELNVSVLKILIHSALDEQALDKDIEYSNLTLFINPNYDLYGFRSNSKKGNMQINLHNINISIFKIETISGNINAQLNNSDIYDEFRISTTSGTLDLFLDNINFYTDFFSLSDSGHQYHDFWNLRFLSGADFTASSSTGIIKVRWANHFIKPQNLDVIVASNNIVEFRLWSPIQIVRMDILLICSGPGTTRFTRTRTQFEEIDTNHYQSKNINNNGLDLFNIKAITYYGEAHVRHIDCFKMKRICDHHDIDPFEENLIGGYEIPKKDHNVSQIDLYNLKYIYLNITKPLDLNFELFPGLNENILSLNWDLTYIRGSAFGMGELRVDTNETQGDILQVYIQLEFELDRLLPTITECNFTVFIHPGYDFYNYTI